MSYGDNQAQDMSIVPGMEDYSDIKDFLAKHAITKNVNKKPITNTRIGDNKKNIYGGSYHISDAEYDTFLKLYYRDIVSKNKKEYLTEKQRDDNGPLVVDLDFRYMYDIDEKQHNNTEIEDLILLYGEELKKVYQLNKDVNIPVYIFEKPTVNRLKEKNITKDGIHILIGLQCDRNIQMYIRKKVMESIRDIWSDLPITNTWNDVFDEGISKGHVNWQLYGSRKPGFDKYAITRIFEIGYDDDDDELSLQEIPVSKFDMEKQFHTLSVRNTNNVSLFMKNDFISTFEKMGNEFKQQKRPRNVMIQQTDQSIFENRLLSNIKNREELDHAVDVFLDSVTNNNDEYYLKTMHEYAMILPESYYGEGSYIKWIRVLWCLKNTHPKLLITWLAFSARKEGFSFSDIPDLCSKWSEQEVKGDDGLTKLSLIHWVKKECEEEYERIKMNTIDYYIDQTINSSNSKYKAPDNDLAKVLYQWFKHEFVCVGLKNTSWHRFKDNRWKEDDSGVNLRKGISGAIRDLYNQRSVQLMQNISASKHLLMDSVNNEAEDDVQSENDTNKTKSLQILNIIQRLGSTTDKIKIMTEAKELFYNSYFLQKLDENPYLLCFKNGIVDFKAKTFRKGTPEDYVSRCTNINYIELNESHNEIKKEITTFMEKLFPERELCNYMWSHLASTLIGTSANQTFNMYHGHGQNGKSVLINLMEKVLGDYKGDVPVSLITGARANVGGLSPEIVQLKGIRYAVMQEPSKKEVINEGIMKQITSGKDPLTGRAPYQAQVISFIPQCKLVVACNNLMGIKSNDHGTWRRIRTVPFKSLFTENPVAGDKDKPYQFKIDKYIDEKFDKWKEVMASMLVDIVYKTDGVVEDCSIVLEKSNEYRESQDYISEFIKDRVIKDTDGKIKKTELNNDFSIWYASNYGGRGPSPKDLHEYMDKQYGRIRNQSWSGVRIRYEQDNDDIFEKESDDNDITNNDL